MALAIFWQNRTDNVGLIYNSAGPSYSGVLDDYYYFVRSPATLAAPISPAVCTSASPCTISLSQALGVACPSGWEVGCTIRIGGKDVVKPTSYAGTTLTVNSGTVGGAHPSGAILNSHPAGASIEYVKQGNQSVDIALHTPIYMYGSWFPAINYDLGTPDATNGFNYPCNGTFLAGSPGCVAVSGPSIAGNPRGCSGTSCAPLLRRDFSRGPYGDVRVLMRPTSQSSHPTASTEYDTPSVPYSLDGTFYPLKADGTFGAGITSISLRGGEAAILVQSPP
jgi:hypothetical protein